MTALCARRLRPACATPFPPSLSAEYRESVLEFVEEVGLTGVETDGQYEDYACADAGGDHHHNGLEGSWDAQMAATASFNEQLKQLGVYQTGADAYLFSGANCESLPAGFRVRISVQ